MKKTTVMLLILAILISMVPLIGISAQGGKPIEIVSVQTQDPDGNPKTVFARGDTVVVNVTIRSVVGYYYGSVAYLLIVEDQAPDYSIPGIAFVTDTIDPGQEKSVGCGFRLPSDTPTGTHHIYVFVWNGWISQMGENWRELADPAEVTITVTSG